MITLVGIFTVIICLNNSNDSIGMSAPNITKSIAHGNGLPIAYISSCEIDLDGNDKSDVVILAETTRGIELIALLKSERGYDGYILATDVSEMMLSCKYGDEVALSKVYSNEEDKVYKTAGAYIELTQPECCSRAYVWNDSEFVEISTSD